MQKIIFYLTLGLYVFTCYTDNPQTPKPNYGWDTFGLQSAAAILNEGLIAIGEKAEKLAAVAVSSEGVTALAAIGQNAGQNFGQNIGVGALTTIGAGITQTVVATKAGVMSTAFAMQAGAVSAATAAVPFIPYAVGGAAVAGTAYVWHRVYRAYNPTHEDKLAAIIREAKALEAERLKVEKKILLEKEEKESRVLEAQRALEACLKKNRSCRKTGISGRPTVCEEAAYAFAMASGSKKKLEEITRLHNELVWE